MTLDEAIKHCEEVAEEYKLCELYKHMGITREHVMKYQEETNEED